MTHDELLAKINWNSREAISNVWSIHHEMCSSGNCPCEDEAQRTESSFNALRAVVELHKPEMLHRGYEQCTECGYPSQYPCETIQAIEKELK